MAGHRREGAGRGLVIDLDGTLITARSDKEGAAPTFKKGYGFHPMGAWLANTGESLAMLLRPGNAGSNTFAGHLTVLAAAIRQIPLRMRCRLLVRVDGAGASHELITHLLSLSSRRRTVLFTSGWMITEADEQAIRLLPASAWQPAVDQHGVVQQDKHIAEITHLLSRAGLRWIVRRTKPSRRQARNLTAFERATGWRYSIIVTSIPAAGRVPACPAATTPSSSTCCTASTPSVEDGVRAGKSMGLRNLPSITSKTWQVNRGWVIAANIAADLAAWTRLLGHSDDADLREADPDTLRPGSGTSPPASPVTPGSGSWASAQTGRGRRCSSPAGSGSAPYPHPPDQRRLSRRHERRHTRRGRSRCAPGHPGRSPPQGETDMRLKTDTSTISNRTSNRLND